MADLIVENLILSVQLHQPLELEKINTIFSDSSFEPEQLPAVVVHYHNPSRAVFITTQGKMVCTGSKTEDDAVQALNHTAKKLKENEYIKESTQINPCLESIVVSKKLNVSLPLASLQTKLPSHKCTYQPSIHPWLEYQEEGYSLLIFCTGDIICTGKLTLEESKEAYNKIEDVLSSVGCKVAE